MVQRIKAPVRRAFLDVEPEFDDQGAFGGQGSQTAFGPRAAANVLTRLTTWSAIIFMLTSISLTVLYSRSTSGYKSALESTQSAPAKSGK